jgi:hypothetical protein
MTETTPDYSENPKTRESYRVYKNGSFAYETALTPEKAEKLDGWQQWDGELEDFVTYRTEHVDDFEGPQLGDYDESESIERAD